MYIWGKVGKVKDSTPHIVESVRNKSVLELSCNFKTTVVIVGKEGKKN